MTNMPHHFSPTIDVNDTKIITVKGVDSHLYAHFSKLVNLTPASSGLLFSHILLYYMRNIKPLRPVSPGERLKNPSNHINYEIIEDQNNLIITKEDLDIGDIDVQFVFINIQDLVFDETIDTELVAKFVHSIKNSNVKVKGDVSKLIMYSIDHSNQRALKRSDELKDVTIRNVVRSIYEEFTALCHSDQITIGEGISRMLSHMIPHLEVVELIKRFVQPGKPAPVIISLREKINVTKKDLKAIENRKVLFHRILELNFEDDIPVNLFTEKILGIYNCEKVNFPKELPKLLKLSKNKTYP